jgi:Xaa-Pro aminopeptidase
VISSPIDCGVTLEGFVGDTATTVPVGEVDEEKLKLIRITEECLERAIQQCRAGNHLGDIGWAVQQHAEANGYSVVRDYVGHGIGRRMHEDPQIPNYGRPGLGPKIKTGYVFAVEPMLNQGSPFYEGLVGRLDGCDGRRQAQRARGAYDRDYRGRSGGPDAGFLDGAPGTGKSLAADFRG